jgi:MFS family permease
LVSAFALIFYAHPSSDDFCRAGYILESGVLDTIKKEYFGWSGRWAAHAIEFVVPSILDLITSYSLLLAFIAILYLLALFSFFSTLFKYDLSRKSALTLAVSVFTLYLVGISSTGQVFYWFTGGVEYQLSLACMLFLFTGLLRVGKKRGLVTFIQTFGLCILAFITTGMHELFGLIFCIILGISTLIAFKIRHPHRIVWGVVFLATILGFLVVFFAPGNKVRISYFPKYGDLNLALYLTLRNFKFYLKRWVLDVRLLSATFIFIITPKFRAIRPTWFFRHDNNLRLIVPITWFIVLIAAFFGPSWAIGKTLLAGRVSSAIYMFFLIGWFSTVFVFTRWPLGENSNGEDILKPLRAFAIVILALSLLATGNTPSVVRDLIGGRAVRYNQNMKHRYEKIYSEIKEGKLDVRVPLVKDRPKSMFNYGGLKDISKDPEDWRNECAARFFQLKSIAVDQ